MRELNSPGTLPAFLRFLRFLPSMMTKTRFAVLLTLSLAVCALYEAVDASDGQRSPVRFGVATFLGSGCRPADMAVASSLEDDDGASGRLSITFLKAFGVESNVARKRVACNGVISVAVEEGKQVGLVQQRVAGVVSLPRSGSRVRADHDRVLLFRRAGTDDAEALRRCRSPHVCARRRDRDRLEPVRCVTVAPHQHGARGDRTARADHAGQRGQAGDGVQRSSARLCQRTRSVQSNDTVMEVLN
ncbi:hypothetical protein PINS_up008453 [Pythium insidiosum]|nr:hypothetical protein PINS_up008453 [Pythium insidiosum]